MSSLRFASVDTLVGPLVVAETDAGVAAVARPEELEPLLSGLARRFPGLDAAPGKVDARWVVGALSGGPLPPVDLGGLPEWDAAVYRAVRSIRAGETATYGEVAAMIGSPGAARAVGGAMSRCPLFPAVPCHRVVRAADGWSGWGGDVRLKRRLLSGEQARRPAEVSPGSAEASR